jgi:hypothetical protein
MCSLIYISNKWLIYSGMSALDNARPNAEKEGVRSITNDEMEMGTKNSKREPSTSLIMANMLNRIAEDVINWLEVNSDWKTNEAMQENYIDFQSPSLTSRQLNARTFGFPSLSHYFRFWKTLAFYDLIANVARVGGSAFLYFFAPSLYQALQGSFFG